VNDSTDTTAAGGSFAKEIYIFSFIAQCHLDFS
jgi:hypothetical protein